MEMISQSLWRNPIMNNLDINRKIISDIFDKRLTKAKKQLTEEVKGTNLEGNILAYDGYTMLFTHMTKPFPEYVMFEDIDSQYYNSLDRVVAIMKEMQQIGSILRFMANYADSPEEHLLIYMYLVMGKVNPDHQVKLKADELMEQHTSKIEAIRYSLVLRDMYV